MKTNQKIRKIVDGRMEVRISRESAYKPGFKFVQMYSHANGSKRVWAVLQAVSADLIAAGIPTGDGRAVHGGHYSNEISFFIPINF
jgi:hypothetical protein